MVLKRKKAGRQPLSRKHKEIKNSDPETKILSRSKSIIKEQDIARKVDNDKRLMMWTGVTFFMLLIVVLWVFNLRNVFELERANLPDSNLSEDWEKLSDDIGEKMELMKQNLELVSDFADIAPESTSSLPKSGETRDLFATSTPIDDENGLDELIDILESSDVGTSS